MIVDTSILVAAERGRAKLDAMLSDDDDVSMAAVTAAELWVGVDLADAKHRAKRALFVEQVLATIPAEDYDLEVARVHADLLVQMRRQGRPRGSHELLIAATAIARDRAVVTLDRAGFEGIEGLDLRHA
ncbi:MAG TPA: PIN domain-containing protein [Actinomycetota bacterium]